MNKCVFVDHSYVSIEYEQWACVCVRLCNVSMSASARIFVRVSVCASRMCKCMRLVYSPFDKHSVFLMYLAVFHGGCQVKEKSREERKTLHKTRENKIKQLIKIKVCECAHLNLYAKRPEWKWKENIALFCPPTSSMSRANVCMFVCVCVCAIRFSCKIPINRKCD